MDSFAKVFAEWQRAEQEAQAVPSATTAQAAEQAHFALTHHPAAHHGRGQIEGRERNRRGGRR